MSLFEDDPVGPALQRAAQQIDAQGGALVRGLRGIATGAAGLAFTPLALGIGTLTVGIVGLAGAIRSATNEATNFARSMAMLRANQGLSASQGFGLVSRNSLFGISPQATAQMMSGPGMSPLVAGLRGQALGFGSPYASNYLETAAARYQSMPQMLRNQFLDASYGGQAPDEIRQTLNLRPSQIRAQIAYGAQVQGQMGISPEMLARYSAEIPLAAQRIAFAVNMAKVKLAVELAPAIENGIGTVATMLAQNAGKIGAGIERGTRFLVYDLPPMLLRGGAMILRGGGVMLDGLSGIAKGLAGSVRPILTVFDAIINGVRAFAGGLGGVVAFIVQGVGTLWKAIERTGLPGLAQKAGQFINGNDGKTPEERTANGIVGGAAIRYVALPAAAATAGALARRALGGGGAGSSWLQRLRFAGGTAINFLRTTPLGTLGGATPAGMLRAFSMPVVAAGTALGVAGYEAMRRYNVFGYASMPSTAQILGHYSGLTDSPTEQARAAHSAQVRAQRAQAEMKRSPLGAFGYQEGRSPFDAFSDGRSAVSGMMGTSNLAGSPAIIGALEHLFGRAGDAAGNGSRNLLGLADKADQMAGSWKREREEDTKVILREIASNTKQGAGHQLLLLQNMPAYIRDMTARVSAYIAEDNALNLMRA